MEGFVSSMSSTHGNYAENANFSQWDIKGTGYSHNSDVKIMAANYFMYKGTMMPPPNIESQIIKEFKIHPFLFYMARNNLAHAEYVIEKITKLSSSKSYSDEEYKKELFEDILARNSATHERPSKSAKLGIIYEHLLQNIAQKYIKKVDNQGYFEVNVTDTIAVIADQDKNTIDVFGLDRKFLNRGSGCKPEIYTLNVQSVLDYSGLVTMKPPSERNREYRFEPFWLHKFLVNERAKRDKN